MTTQEEYIMGLEQEVSDVRELLRVYKGVAEKQALEIKLLQEHVKLASHTIEILIDDETEEQENLLQGA